MHRRYEDYIFHSLAACGLAVLDPQHAFLTRADLWSSPHSAVNDFNLAEIETGIRARGYVIFILTDGIPCATRSLRDIEARLEYITGKTVRRVVTVSTFIKPAEPKAATTREREGAFEHARLRKVAAQTLPDHDCPMRREIMSARRAVGYAEAEGRT